MLSAKNFSTSVKMLSAAVAATLCFANLLTFNNSIAAADTETSSTTAAVSSETIKVKLYNYKKEQTTQADGIKVSNTVREELPLDVSKILFLNFATTAGAALSESAIAEWEKTDALYNSDLVAVDLPASANLSDTSNVKVQVNPALQPNELTFTASKASAWLINLQLANYELAEMEYDRANKEIKLYYKEIASAAKRLSYYSGQAHGNISYWDDNKLPVLANLINVLKAANVKSDNSNGIYNLLDGNFYSKDVKKLAADDSLVALAKSDNLPRKEQTLSLTLIRHGLIEESFFNLALAAANTLNAYPNGKLGNDTGSKYQSVTLSNNGNAAAQGTSKYKTVVLSANDNTLVQSTGEAAASIEAALLCFSLATAAYALKRRLRL